MSAPESSLRNTITIEDAFVKNSKKMSAGRFLERWEEIEIRKLVKVRRQDEEKESSTGNIGSYHHLYAHHKQDDTAQQDHIRTLTARSRR